jgi:hypothetical protein
VPNKWVWPIVFLISIGGLSYMGLNPNLIKDWWWVLVSYNVVVIFIAGCLKIMAHLSHICANYLIKIDTKANCC